MKKRLIAVILTIVMLFCALPLYASANDSSLSELISSTISSGKTSYPIIADLTVDGNTTVPYGFTLYLQSGVTLTLNAKLTVFGMFVNCGGTVVHPENLINLSYIYYGNPGQAYDPYSYYLFYQTYGFYPSDIYGTYPGYYYGYPSAPIFVPGSGSGDYNYSLYLYLLNNGYSTSDIWNYMNGLQRMNYFTCAAPAANVKSGTTVTFNAPITLTTATSGASIYYTTDGSTPDSTSALYSSPISVNKTDMVIKAITVKSGYNNSNVATFAYKTSIPLSFTDLGAYSAGLTPSLVTLVQAKIIADANTLNPDGSFSYDELLAWLKATGANTAGAVIDEALITNKSALSFEDFAYVTYRALIKTSSVLSSPRFSSKDTLGKLKYGSEVTATPSMLRAGIMSMVEANLLYGGDFHPKTAATRAYAFYMLAQVYNRLH